MPISREGAHGFLLLQAAGCRPVGPVFPSFVNRADGGAGNEYEMGETCEEKELEDYCQEPGGIIKEKKCEEDREMGPRWR